MPQLIARIADELHAKLKAKARAEGRSLNAVVTEALKASLGERDARERLTARLTLAGWRVVPPPPERAPSESALAQATRGTGTAVSEALAGERARR